MYAEGRLVASNPSSSLYNLPDGLAHFPLHDAVKLLLRDLTIAVSSIVEPSSTLQESTGSSFDLRAGESLHRR